MRPIESSVAVVVGLEPLIWGLCHLTELVILLSKLYPPLITDTHTIIVIKEVTTLSITAAGKLADIEFDPAHQETRQLPI